jgi:arylsulfatase A-like enzyme
VDTLRADYLGCYGFPLETSPAIDRLAAESLVFEDCVCEVPLTNPSFGAMMSSLYPRMTGTTRNGLPMPSGVPLAAELFREAGYQTACVQSNWTLKARLSGLDRGFDAYEDDFRGKRYFVFKGERPAERVTDIAVDLLANRDRDRPFFYWIHYSDPHSPYKFHPRHNVTGKRLSREDDEERTRMKYASEVAYTDEHIGRFLDALPRENTFVLFVADHGESLHEHGYLGHGRRVYQTSQRVPLIIHGPGISAGRTALPVRTFDVGPTLLALAGIEPAPGMLGQSLLKVDAKTTRFIETYGGAVPGLPGMKALVAPEAPMRRGLIAPDGWKLILGDRRPELFYLPDDPMEERNLAAVHPGRVKSMQEQIARWDKQHPRGAAAPVELSGEDAEALRSLGYLD